MPEKLTTTLSKIHGINIKTGRPYLQNQTNAGYLDDYYHFLCKDKSPRTISKNMKGMIHVSQWFERNIGIDVNFEDNSRLTTDVISKFLNSKILSLEEDPEEASRRTYNFYLEIIKNFFRWFYNVRLAKQENDILPRSLWKTPLFLQRISQKPLRRLTPYDEYQIWDRDDILFIVQFEQEPRRKAALTLLWDLDARNHEIALLKIKNVRLKERYGEGEISERAKTGSGPIFPLPANSASTNSVRSLPDNYSEFCQYYHTCQ